MMVMMVTCSGVASGVRRRRRSRIRPPFTRQTPLVIFLTSRFQPQRIGRRSFARKFESRRLFLKKKVEFKIINYIFKNHQFKHFCISFIFFCFFFLHKYALQTFSDESISTVIHSSRVGGAINTKGGGLSWPSCRLSIKHFFLNKYFNPSWVTDLIDDVSYVMCGTHPCRRGNTSPTRP